MKKRAVWFLSAVCVLLLLGGCKSPLDSEPSMGTQSTVQRTTTTTSAVTAPTEYRPGIDGDCSDHNPFYHIIDEKLLTHVGADKAAAFTAKYKDTENYNVVKFVAEHGISKATFREVLGITADNENELYDEDILCDFTKKEFVDAIYGTDKALFNRVFAYHKP